MTTPWRASAETTAGLIFVEVALLRTPPLWWPLRRAPAPAAP